MAASRQIARTRPQSSSTSKLCFVSFLSNQRKHTSGVFFVFAVTFGPPDTLFEQVGVVLEKGGSIKVDGQNQTTILKYLVPPQNLALSVSCQQA